MIPKISLCAAATRPDFWKRFYNSLSQNIIPYEVVFVGPLLPSFNLPDNLTFIKSNVKPAQAYEIAFRHARGEIIGWTADDANYNSLQLNCPKSLDIIWERYCQSFLKYRDNKTILAMCPLEDSSAEYKNHFFFYGDIRTPRMAPFGFINREWFNTLGGYDRNFVCGQSENDVVMRALVDGGRIESVEEAWLHVHHAECHGPDYPFRSGYDGDRKFLENCWVKEGYGTYEVQKPYSLSDTRLISFEPFNEENILTINQGPAGRWEKVMV